MSIIINNINLNIEEDISKLKSRVAKKISVKDSDIREMRVLKESIDARKKNNIIFSYTVEIEIDNEERLVKKANTHEVRLNKPEESEIEPGNETLNSRPIIVGMGPAGLFAGLKLAQRGYKPLILERGEDVDKRSLSVNKFWMEKELKVNSNVQFGEGGAGTFSDGKLTTRIKDKRVSYVLGSFVEAGADEEVKYKAKPHIGTDVLKGVVKNIRKRIIDLGGKVRFNSRVDDLIIDGGKARAVVVNGERIESENIIIAIGHSARDTYEMLYNKGVSMTGKPFAIGVRVEHPQEMININQYGDYANHPRLKAAEYALTFNTKDKRGVYSFCMCPGGVVVAASSEEERFVVNGMSYHARDGKNANSALVVTVGQKDFGEHPLDGIAFQRHYEKLAYKLNGGYLAPVQTIGDFLNETNKRKIVGVEPSVTTGYEFSNLNKCLPSYITSSIKEAMGDFDRKIKGYAREDGIFTGIETRTSAPVRINREKTFESENVEGLYPCGEGAGYAGGIMSAAVDGIKCAEAIIKKYRPLG